jgi:hypothetical protein
MCVCVCVCIHIFMQTYVWVCLYIYIYIYIIYIFRHLILAADPSLTPPKQPVMFAWLLPMFLNMQCLNHTNVETVSRNHIIIVL